MKLHRFLLAVFLAVVSPAVADEDGKPAAGDPPAVPEADKMSPDIRGFYGVITGTVESVNQSEISMKIKVTKAEPDAAKNKAPKPESMPGQSITVTPLAKQTDGKSVLDEKASGYIKGAKSGDPVTLAVRASREGVVFRLLKVPSAGSK